MTDFDDFTEDDDYAEFLRWKESQAKPVYSEEEARSTALRQALANGAVAGSIPSSVPPAVQMTRAFEDALGHGATSDNAMAVGISTLLTASLAEQNKR